ncbi:MAG TPA: hypothetical protein DDY78_16090 [Planctomycetales bacterium]|jgi:hypothetical protein|nr:hypothetical protein [Planctomycetales bacterium]
MTPTRPPTATELLQDAGVRQVIEQAWLDSLANDPILRHEEGGWIYLDLTSGVLSFIRAIAGATSGISLSAPPTVAGAVVVGKFHTHPNPEIEGWTTGPSPSDLRIDAAHGVPDLIRAEDGVHFSGPVTRRGGLAGGPGYPP